MKDRQFEFRAVYMQKTGEEIDYESLPIQQAIKPYCTVGLYESKELENGTVVQDHVADMPIEDFKAVQEQRFPNGFDSWQETHFEMVETLTRIRMMKEEDQPASVRDLQTRFGSTAFYSVVEGWTNEFELKNKGREWDGEYFEEVEEFIEEKVGKEYL